MTPEADWYDLGPAEELAKRPLQQLTAGRTRLALVYRDGTWSAISGACNHVGGPLGEGRVEGDYVVCPWHYWKFHCVTGEGEPGYEADRVPSYEVEVRDGHVWVNLTPKSRRNKLPHKAHPLARKVERAPGPVRVVGISTTTMTAAHPRFSTSDHLLELALARAADRGSETQLIRLRDLAFRSCEGFYSKSAHACTWPCSITQMDKKDQLDVVYEAFVHWADVILIATPIRWGVASSLYYKMVERMNCIQNQETIANRHLLRNKVASFLITGGQDNVQAVAGQMMVFFGEVGCQFPQFPFIAHSRGWSAEDMENNVIAVRDSALLADGARALADRAIEMAEVLLAGYAKGEKLRPGGRKGHAL